MYYVDNVDKKHKIYKVKADDNKLYMQKSVDQYNRKDEEMQQEVTELQQEVLTQPMEIRSLAQQELLQQKHNNVSCNNCKNTSRNNIRDWFLESDHCKKDWDSSNKKVVYKAKEQHYNHSKQ